MAKICVLLTHLYYTQTGSQYRQDYKFTAAAWLHQSKYHYWWLLQNNTLTPWLSFVPGTVSAREERLKHSAFMVPGTRKPKKASRFLRLKY